MLLYFFVFIDPDAFSARISAQQAYAQKLQDKYDKQAEDYQAKLKEVCFCLIIFVSFLKHVGTKVKQLLW